VAGSPQDVVDQRRNTTYSVYIRKRVADQRYYRTSGDRQTALLRVTFGFGFSLNDTHRLSRVPFLPRLPMLFWVSNYRYGWL